MKHVPLYVSMLNFLSPPFERQCAHAEPPPTPARAAKGAFLHTNGRIRARLGRPRAATCRAGAPFFGLISILKIKYRKIHVRNKFHKKINSYKKKSGRENGGGNREREGERGGHGETETPPSPPPP